MRDLCEVGADNLTPNPFPSGKGNRIRGLREVIITVDLD